MRLRALAFLLRALRAGFEVSRNYEAVDDPADVRLDIRGVWHFRAGARVRAIVEMKAPTLWYHVALIDPLPAGLEGVKPGGSDGWGRWDHENLRDDRAEAFVDAVSGRRTYKHLLRATTRGTFLAAPAHVEEMYHPETFGRSASERVIVE